MRSLENLNADCVRTDKDKTFNTSETFRGYARFMKPNLAAMKLDRVGGVPATDFELYVSNGQKLYEYRPKQKLVRTHDIPKDQKGGLTDDTLLGFLFGMEAQAAKKRYGLKLAKEDDGWWVYVDVIPKEPRDKQEFSRAQMILFGPKWQGQEAQGRKGQAYLPTRLWFESNNGNEIVWEFPKVDVNIKLEAVHFAPPPAPKDWQVVDTSKESAAPKQPAQPVQQQPPPTTARPQKP
jgi:TIGR03009 family protein